MGKKVLWRARQLRREMAAKQGRDVSLGEVADATGIAISTLSYLENNKGRGLDFGTLEKLAEFYGVEGVNELLSMEDQRRTPALAGAL